MSDMISSTDATNMYKGQKSMLVMVVAKSGRGKSTAMRNMDPEDTFLISSIGKPLPFPKGMKWIEGHNKITQSNSDTIRRAMTEVSNNEKNKHFKHLVIDDGQYIMATEFMNQAAVKGYDKWTIMAKNLWDILNLSTKLRGDLKVFFLTHEEESSSGERKMKTLGRLLDEKITPEGMSTIVLYGDVVNDEQKRTYYFSTQSDGYTNAKSPFDMFPQKIPNDLQLISQRIDEYYQGVELKDSKLNFSL